MLKTAFVCISTGLLATIVACGSATDESNPDSYVDEAANTVICGTVGETTAKSCPAGTYLSKTVATATSGVCAGRPEYTCTPFPQDLAGVSFTVCGASPFASSPAGALPIPPGANAASYIISASSKVNGNCAIGTAPLKAKYAYTVLRPSTSAGTGTNSCGLAAKCPLDTQFIQSSKAGDISSCVQEGANRYCKIPSGTEASLATACGAVAVASATRQLPCPTGWKVDVGTDRKTEANCDLENGVAAACIPIASASDTESVVCGTAAVPTPACPAGKAEVGSRAAYAGCAGNKKAVFCKALPADPNASSVPAVTQCGSSCPAPYYASSSTIDSVACGMEAGNPKQNCVPFKTTATSGPTVCGQTCPADSNGRQSFVTGSSVSSSCLAQAGKSVTCGFPSATATTFDLCDTSGATTPIPAGWYIQSSDQAGSSCAAFGNNVNHLAKVPTAAGTITICGIRTATYTCPTGFTAGASSSINASCAVQGYKSFDCTK